jgi:predicted urease superfamily metal-dependent hydrolase
MKEQALKVAKDFDELAEIGFEHVLRSEGDSAISRQLMQYQVQFAKEHQANAQLLRDLVAEIERLEDANKNN